MGPVLVRRGSNEHPLSARLLDSRVVVLSLSSFRNSYKLDRSITAKNITDPRVGRPTNARERVEATETNKKHASTALDNFGARSEDRASALAPT